MVIVVLKDQANKFEIGSFSMWKLLIGRETGLACS